MRIGSLALLAAGLAISPLHAAAPAQLRVAVNAYIQKQGDSTMPEFRHVLIDLDADSQPDAIVLLTGQAWCGAGGCTMLVLRHTDTGFTLVSSSTVVSEPIRISAERQHNWSSLIVFANKVGDVMLQFDGTRYPRNASLQPKASAAQLKAAKIVLE